MVILDKLLIKLFILMGFCEFTFLDSLFHFYGQTVLFKVGALWDFYLTILYVWPRSRYFASLWYFGIFLLD